MAEQFTVLTVCTGNIHRSPLAAELLRTWAEWYLPAEVAASVTIASAGTGAPVGRPMGRTAARIARTLGADPDAHRARQLTDAMIEEADLVLVAATDHRDDVLARSPRALRKAFTVREAGRLSALLGDGADAPPSVDRMREVVREFADRRAAVVVRDTRLNDIVDPHRQGDDAYLQMTREAVAPLAETARVLFGMPPAETAAYTEIVEDADRLRALVAGTL